MSNSSLAPSMGSSCTDNSGSLLALQIVVAIESIAIFVGIVFATITASGGWNAVMKSASQHISTHSSKIGSTVAFKLVSS